MSFSVQLEQGSCHFIAHPVHHPSRIITPENDVIPPQIDDDQPVQDAVEVIVANWLARRNDNEANEIIKLISWLSQEKCSMRSHSFEQVFNLTCSLLDADGMDEFQLTTFTAKIAEFEYIEPKLIKSLCKAIERKISQDTPWILKNLIVFLWNFAEFGVNDRTLLDKLIKIIKDDLTSNNNVTGEDLGYIFCALAKLGYSHVPLISCLNKHIQPKLGIADSFSGKDLANIAWSYAELRRENIECIVPLKNIIDGNLENPDFFVAADAICIAWAFIIFKIYDQESMTKLLSIIEHGLDVQSITSREQQLLLELHDLLKLSNFDVSQYEQICVLVTQTKETKQKREVRDKEFSKCVMATLKNLQCNSKNGVLICRVLKPTHIVGQSILFPVYMKIEEYPSPKSKKADLNFVIEMSPPQSFLVNPEEGSHPPRRSYRGKRTLAHPDRFMYLSKPNTKQCLLERAGWKYVEIPHFKWDKRNGKQRTSYVSAVIAEFVKKIKSEIFAPVQHAPNNLGQQFQRLSLELKKDGSDDGKDSLDP